MRKNVPLFLQNHRLHIPDMDNGPHLGFNGAFQIMGPCGRDLRIVSSDATKLQEKYPWEHVSVSLSNRCPNWIEMCFVKNLFWDEEETVIQYHPAKSDYINCHPYCLHMWRPTTQAIPLPPTDMVGPRNDERIEA